VNSAPPDYNALYFDSNELLANGWPDLSVKLSNVLQVGQWWKVEPFIPMPVLDETEAHWLRTVETQASRIASAKRELERIVRPIECDVSIQLTDLDQLRSRYRVVRDEAVKKYRINVIPYANRPAEFFFHRATKYSMPFEKEREGKGFQDAVILQSVLDHLQKNAGLKGMLVTKDSGMVQAQIREFLPEFDPSRLRISVLDDVWDNLFQYNFDQTVTQPWAEERRNAMTAAESLVPLWKDFLKTHLTENMLRAGGFGTVATVMKLISVDMVRVTFVDTPIPDLYAEPDRDVRISVSVSADCTAIVKKEHTNFLALFGSFDKDADVPAAPPEIVQEKTVWSGGIRATAKIINRQFQDIVPESLVSEDELRAQN
jgi:hypothetical protein